MYKWLITFIIATVVILISEMTIALDTEKMLCLVNAAQPLLMASCLNDSAQRHSNNMSRQRSMRHLLPGEPQLSTRINSSCSSDIMNVWMNSPGHYNNIMGDYTHFGVGKSSNNGTPYWTQNFAKGLSGGTIPIALIPLMILAVRRHPMANDSSSSNGRNGMRGRSSRHDSSYHYDVYDDILSGRQYYGSDY
ncbi:hypothetical protein BDF22DRAFT_691601 [Syncephalis plumigaleata]|nr:hypothetical protein BDF22DRAFT_691601 [Syncephalis plumigaleata]